MVSEENINVNLEKNDKNQENFEKKKKIVLISLSAAIVFITLIAGLFFVKKNKGSGYKNDDLEGVVDEENGGNEEEENREVSDYFFEKKSGSVTINILSFLIIGILLFFWENDKNTILVEEVKDSLERLKIAHCGVADKDKNPVYIGVGLFEKANWFGFATLGALITITVIVEAVLNPLIGSISYFLSEDKSKEYFDTLGMSLIKRIQYFSSFSITKTSFVGIGYLLCGIIVAIVARVTERCKICCCRDTGEIITDHNNNYCCGYCEDSKVNELKKVNGGDHNQDNDNHDNHDQGHGENNKQDN